MNNFEDLFLKVEEMTKHLRDKYENGEISKFAYDELLEFGNDKKDFKDNVEAFKYYFNLWRPIKCSELLYEIFREHTCNFRKAVLLSNCIPDPLGYTFTEEIYDLVIEILSRSYNLRIAAEEHEFKLNIREIFLTIDALYKNNLSNGKKMMDTEFSSFSLSEQLRMCLILLQDQSRLMRKKMLEDLDPNRMASGMELAISDQIATDNSGIKMSYLDNYEAIIESLDRLFRYLYFSKKKELKIEKIPDHGDIHYFSENSLALVRFLSNMRGVYVWTWEQFKYSDFAANLVKIGDMKVYLFKPKDLVSYRRRTISQLRRNYMQISSKLQTRLRKHNDSNNKELKSIIGKIEVSNPQTFFLINNSDYIFLENYFENYIDQYNPEKFKQYKDFSFKGVRVIDLINGCKYLRILVEAYDLVLNDEFQEDNYSTYKYLAPVLFVKDIVEHFSIIFDLDNAYSDKVLNCLIFDSAVKGDSDLFCRPLVKAAKNEIILCPSLVEQINIERVIESQLKKNNVDISSIGTKFENKMRFVLSLVENMYVNTNKIEYIAFDGKDIEFDFLAMFDGYLLLWEFKATTSSYGAKEVYDNFKSVKHGIEQIERRSISLKIDWEKVRSLTNIELPRDPIEDEKIIKLVGTNVVDYTGYSQNGIRVFDESTLLKFFINPKVDAISIHDQKKLAQFSLWKGKSPTAKDLLLYLENPVTTSPYNKCFETHLKRFPILDEKYPIALYDEILVKDPYSTSLSSMLNKKSSNPKKTKSKKKKRRKR